MRLIHEYLPDLDPRFLQCLPHDHPSAVPFFQQVLAIAEDDHLVSISDYAIAQFLEQSLHPTDQKQLENLLERIDIWQLNPSDYQSATELSQTQGITIADAIDHIIYNSLCPDWILVAASSRSLPSATAIQSFCRIGAIFGMTYRPMMAV
ncbi:MAG: hypothetical protein HC805_08740 [Alkalinema sp. RL_2_19]|nr:hypothetical protein [Alkalinema sp. RL_2_19]